MDLQPKLVPVRVPKAPTGVVLVLHGGAARRENMMVSPTQLSVLRMIPIARRLARAGRNQLAVFRLLNSRRGWDAHHTPVHDARWALDEIADRLGGPLPRPSSAIRSAAGRHCSPPERRTSPASPRSPRGSTRPTSRPGSRAAGSSSSTAHATGSRARSAPRRSPTP